MSCSVSVRICDNGKEIYNETRTAQEMHDSGYKQPQLKTDEEPLDALKENDLFYLAAAVEKMKDEVGTFLSQRIESNGEKAEGHDSKKPRIENDSTM